MTRCGPVAPVLVLLLVGSTAGATDLAGLFERVDPAVVEIATIEEVVDDEGGSPQRVRAGGLGSGFLISRDGLVMTASHVVHLAEDIAVRWVTGEVSNATMVSSNPHADVAIIRVDTVPETIAPVPLGDSDRVRVGDEVFIIGAPMSYAHSLSAGHVSARRTPKDLFGGIEPVELLQTDAAINEGNSGGPMFNLDGEVIGVVSHILSQGGGSEGLGFVVTSNLARAELLDKKPFWSGIDGFQLTEEWARIFNLPQSSGILVQNVVAGSPAARLGLQPGAYRAEIDGQRLTVGGDVILAIQGIPVGTEGFTAKVEEALGELGGEELLELKVLRGGRVISLTMPIGELR